MLFLLEQDYYSIFPIPLLQQKYYKLFICKQALLLPFYGEAVLIKEKTASLLRLTVFCQN